MGMESDNKMKIIIIHPDLGLGGAERLIVDVAKAMKVLGHDVKLYTSHHDPSRCFEETKGDGVIADCIEVHGNWLPRQIFGKCTALCAMVRMLYASLVAIFGHYVGKSKPTLIFLDSVSAPIPLFLVAGIPSMFYCHFPDKLLCVERGSFLKKIYRFLIDNFEEASTGCANEIVVNSVFTSKVFAENFHTLGKLCQPKVLYPTIELPEAKSVSDVQSIEFINRYDFVFVSLNRYERKKNINLAIHAFNLLLKQIENIDENDIRKKPHRVLLVIAGGYDERVVENVEHCEELRKLAEGYGADVSSNTIFMRSISDAERNALLTEATAILYTPMNEHFGIVPLEAMGRKTPVIAVRSGGPLETVLDNKTGFLCDNNPESFMSAMHKFIVDDSLSSRYGNYGREHTKDKFTFDAMVPHLEVCLQCAVESSRGHKRREHKFLSNIIISFCCIFVLVIAIALLHMVPFSLSETFA